MINETLAAWRINQGLNLRLIDGISDAGMQCTLSQRGGRNVVRQLTHLQYVRVHQLSRRAKRLAEGATVFATNDEPDRKALTAALADSSERIEEWLRLASEGAKGVRVMPSGLVATAGYLISHESHHRGSILLTLKQCGEPLDRTLRDSMWGEWGKAPSE